MIRGVVVGQVWATRRVPSVPAGALLVVEPESGSGRLVAFDCLGVGVGEEVLVVTGSVAAAYLGGAAPIDALVIGSLDQSDLDQSDLDQPEGEQA